jgi:hypothetical protein
MMFAPPEIKAERQAQEPKQRREMIGDEGS